eukprot:15051112-Alexandrium_andersonii.AAC.1
MHLTHRARTRCTSCGGPANRPAFQAEIDAAQAVATGQRGEARNLHTAPNPGSRAAGKPADRGKLRPSAERS